MRIFFSSLFFLLLLFCFSVTQIKADENCSIRFPLKVADGTKAINLHIDGGFVSKDADPSRRYWVYISGFVIQKEIPPGSEPDPFSASSSSPDPISFQAVRIGSSDKATITALNVGSTGGTNPKPDQPAFRAGRYTVTVREPRQGGNTICAADLIVDPPPAGTAVGPQACTIEFLSSVFTSSDKVAFKVKTADLSVTYPSSKRKIVLKQGGQTGPDYRIYDCQEAEKLHNEGIAIGPFEDGQYFLEIQECTWLASKTLCHINPLKICPGCTRAQQGSGAGKPKAEGSFLNQCKAVDTKDHTKGFVCQTAIGKIETSPGKLVSQLLGIILGIAGGIAVLLIILSGYQMSIAAGNPEKIQEARDRLTSAIVGLVFIILSLSILRIIGVDILVIPGLNQIFR